MWAQPLQQPQAAMAVPMAQQPMGMQPQQPQAMMAPWPGAADPSQAHMMWPQAAQAQTALPTYGVPQGMWPADPSAGCACGAQGACGTMPQQVVQPGLGGTPMMDVQQAMWGQQAQQAAWMQPAEAAYQYAAWGTGAGMPQQAMVPQQAAQPLQATPLMHPSAQGFAPQALQATPLMQPQPMQATAAPMPTMQPQTMQAALQAPAGPMQPMQPQQGLQATAPPVQPMQPPQSNAQQHNTEAARNKAKEQAEEVLRRQSEWAEQLSRQGQAAPAAKAGGSRAAGSGGSAGGGGGGG
eukprot:CAMPEP_0115263940 /NCGR_PEP_ID=MMETSP0270-20121206/50169_1 /TAXON_ID=71861 /ORGANISM="Scrippsiella trochoidea, Strain CCMP3099" /LENGTH=294 /DNA_ID=CAMNT_0002679937 /DNA_START=78 /DNA_END=958 /DNA_ORIENTATION=+